MIIKMLLQFVILTWVMMICKSLEGPNRSVCEYGNGTEYCCYGFGEKSGRCVECHVGYESLDGRHCIPCQPRMYGKHCAKECRCETSERCDSVTGRCYENTVVSTKTPKAKATKSNIFWLFSSYGTTESTYITEGMTNNDQEEETNAFNDLGLSNKGVVVYCTTVAGVIVLLCGIYYLNKCRKRILHSSKEQHVVPRNNGSVVMTEELYDLIDETNMSENRMNMNEANGNAYLEVVDTSVDTSSNLENFTEEKDDSASFLNSYESLAKYVNVQENENNYTSNSSCSTNEPENVQSENDINAYFNLYQSLTGNRRLITHTYEKTVVYNVMKCQSIKYRSISSRSLTIQHNTKTDASSRRFSF